MANWLNWYNCKENPFTVKALTTDKDLVYYCTTSGIKDILNLIIERRDAGIYGVSGIRGIGKTSTLYYIGKKLKDKGEIVIDFRVIENTNEKIANKTLILNILGEMLEKLTYEIYYYHNGIYKKYEKFFSNVLKQLGLEIIDERLMPVDARKQDDGLQRRFIIEILDLLSDKGFRVTFIIDNLDKFLTQKNQRILRDFLCGPFAQSFFEDIVNKNGKIFLALSSEIYDYLKSGSSKWESLNYLTSTVELSRLKDIEAYDVLQFRFKKESGTDLPFDSKVISFLNQKSQGVLRTLMWDATYALQVGAERGVKQINSDNLESLLKSQDIHKLNEILKSTSADFNRATVWLLEIVSKATKKERSELLVSTNRNFS